MQRAAGVLEPTAGEKQRAKITYELELKGVKPVEIAQRARASQSAVSAALSGQRCEGEVTERIYAEVSKVLGQPAAKLFTVKKDG